MLSFDSSVFVPMMIFAVPIVAVAGGITAGIVKTISRHRLLELAQRERIAAIERGVDPSKLPGIPTVLSDDAGASFVSLHQASVHRARGLLVGGIVTLAIGIGLSVMLYFIAGTEADDRNVWAVGAIPIFIGLALLLSSWLYGRFAAEDAAPPRQG